MSMGIKPRSARNRASHFSIRVWPRLAFLTASAPRMSKIKWNDDRIKQTLTALLLIGRTRLIQGATQDLISESLADYRADPAHLKEAHWDKIKGAWSDPADLTAIKHPKHLAYYQTLLAEVEAARAKFKKNQIQFNGLVELDNYLVTYLKSPDF